MTWSTEVMAEYSWVKSGQLQSRYVLVWMEQIFFVMKTYNYPNKAIVIHYFGCEANLKLSCFL